MRSRKSHKAGRKPAIRLAAACAAVSIALTVAIYWAVNVYSVYLVQEFGADIYVNNIVGLNVDVDAIHFGIVAPGSEGLRKMTINTSEYRTLISVESSGPIAEWISVSENNFVMEPHSSKLIWVSAQVPENTTVPNFRKGTVRITFRRLLF